MPDSELLRVCVLLGRYPPDFSGHGTHFQRMAPHLRRAGVEPLIVTTRPASGVSWNADEDQHVQRILPPGRDAPAVLRRVVRLNRWLAANRGRFDLFHAVFLDWSMYLSLPVLARRGVPIVFEMILLGSDDPVSIARQRFGRFKRRQLDRVDEWVGITDAFLQPIREAGIPEARFHSLYTGVDVDVYRPRSPEERRALRARLGLPEEGRVAISVGTLQQRKGMDRVIRAWEATRPVAGRDLLLIAGPATVAEGLRPVHQEHALEVQAMAKAPGVAGTVRVVGRVDDLHDWMAASDVLVFLSRREGLGTVILEALACGLPCLVSPLDGIARELLREGENGYVMDTPDDAGVVGQHLARLLGDPALRARMGESARREAVERFSLQGRAESLAAIYRRLVAAAPSSGRTA